MKCYRMWFFKKFFVRIIMLSSDLVLLPVMHDLCFYLYLTLTNSIFLRDLINILGTAIGT